MPVQTPLPTNYLKNNETDSAKNREQSGNSEPFHCQNIAAHTSGPWDADGLRVAVFGRGIVAVCPRPNDGGVFECSANARLIAAAPDLLAALTAMLGACDAAGKDDDLSIVDTLTEEMENAARAAIAKATGAA